jgi:hypothetical protein
VNSLLRKFVAFTHGNFYSTVIVHLPLAAALVLWKPTASMILFASIIGLWKDVLLDRLYATPRAPIHQYLFAAACYPVGALIGYLGRMT